MPDGAAPKLLRCALTQARPTPPGPAVRCRAQVLRSDGAQFLFKVEAFDEQEKIASGLHRLNVINKARFAGRVARKAKPE